MVWIHSVRAGNATVERLRSALPFPLHREPLQQMLQPHPLRLPPSRIASTMSGASRVSHRIRPVHRIATDSCRSGAPGLDRGGGARLSSAALAASASAFPSGPSGSATPMRLENAPEVTAV